MNIISDLSTAVRTILETVSIASGKWVNMGEYFLLKYDERE